MDCITSVAVVSGLAQEGAFNTIMDLLDNTGTLVTAPMGHQNEADVFTSHNQHAPGSTPGKIARRYILHLEALGID